VRSVDNRDVDLIGQTIGSLIGMANCVAIKGARTTPAREIELTELVIEIIRRTKGNRSEDNLPTWEDVRVMLERTMDEARRILSA
jgi:hypothetical protein